MIFFDITRHLSESVPLYPGDAPPVIIPRDHGTYVTTDLHISSHHGTHIDAPSHFLKGGASVDALSLTSLIGPCRVLDVRDAGMVIEADVIIPRLGSHTRLLLRTAASEMDTFGPEFPCITASAARSLAEKRVVCVGIDSPSVEEYPGDGSVHRILLSHHTVIIELLDLSLVKEGTYYLIALPLRLEGREGSPARVVLCTRRES
jgi:arylformamidase